MSNISRRDALMGATAAAVVTGAIAAPLALKSAGVKAALGGDTVQADDAHLEALYAEWRAAEDAEFAARDIADRTNFAARRSCGPCPLHDLDNLKGEAAVRAIRATPIWEAKVKAAVARSDAAELYHRADALRERAYAAIDRLMDAPAHTPRGVLVKMRGFYYDDEIASMRDGGCFGDDLPGEHAASIFRDLERLAGEISS